MRRTLMALIGIVVLMTTATSFAGDCGDADNSGGVNILDVGYIINYLYRGGPAPNCGPETGTVTDIDGNIYHTIKIGDQWWTVENLKVTHYRNGDIIPNVTDNAAWAGLTTGACCSYNNDEGNVAVYGRLYNWYAVADGRNIAPAGWHVPTDAEWQTLVDYLGGDAVAGGKMKETGTTHWLSPNTGATNESRFFGLPGGYRNYDGAYSSIGGYAHFWSSTEYGIYLTWFRRLNYNDSEVYHYLHNKLLGFSVRCVKD